jgi:hypothetical protein
MTSGLLLAIHVSGAAHSEHHDAHTCPICQQIGILSKKMALAPSDDLAFDLIVVCADAPQLTEHVETRSLHTSYARGPPLSRYPVM